MIIFYTQHLLGVGHLQRTLSITKSLVKKSMDVYVMNGGKEVPFLTNNPGQSEKDGRISVVHLPPISVVDEDFSSYQGIDPSTQKICNINEDYWQKRRDHIHDIVTQKAKNAQILCVEMFPFGRRFFRHEIIGLIEQFKQHYPNGYVVCSVRDILVQKDNPKAYDSMLEIADRYFDFILVHSDPHIVPFDQTFPHTEKLGDKIIYTGYITRDHQEQKIHRDSVDRQDSVKHVVVSFGGGDVGMSYAQKIMHIIHDHPILQDGFIWDFFVKSQGSGERVKKDHKTHYMNVHSVGPTYIDYVKKADLCMGFCGYNSAVELVHLQKRTLFMPFETPTETEQKDRANLLSKAIQWMDVLPYDMLSDKNAGDRLKKAMDQLLDVDPAAYPAVIDMGGAEKTACFLKKLTVPLIKG